MPFKFYHNGENPAVDIVAILLEPNIKVVLIQRKDSGRIALPGGFIDGKENPNNAAARELKEETNLTVDPNQTIPLTKRGGKGTNRDPRDIETAWITTQPFLTFLSTEDVWKIQAQDDAQNVYLCTVQEALQKINYADHKDILQEAVEFYEKHFKPLPKSDHLNLLFQEIKLETAKAVKKHPLWPTDPIHALGIVTEELGECQKEILELTYEPNKTTKEALRKEALHLVATSLRFLQSLDQYKFTPAKRHSQE